MPYEEKVDSGEITIHYFVSISLVIWSKLLFAMEMFIVPMTGRAFWNHESAYWANIEIVNR